MARFPSLATDLRPLVETFTAQITSLIEARARAEARAAVLKAFGADGAFPEQRRSGRPPGAAKKRSPVRARRKPVTVAERQARVLQGRYMGSLRGLAKGDQAKVKAARAQGGMDAALKLAGSLKARASGE